MWRPRDRERYIGGYDPEHEMPDPGRHPGDRWQSDAYRNGARDTRFGYRWNPNHFEERFDGNRDYDRERSMHWDRDARDFGGRGDFDRGYWPDYSRDYDYRGYERDHGRVDDQWDRDRMYGSDRGWDHDRGYPDRNYGWDRDRDRDWRRR